MVSVSLLIMCCSPPATSPIWQTSTTCGQLLDRIDTVDGFPVLDERFQTSVPGLFMSGFVATRDFGPFFGFVRGCPAAATLIVAALLEHH